MEHVLVTGSEGFLRQAICKALVARGYRVSRVDRRLGHDVLTPKDLEAIADTLDARKQNEDELEKLVASWTEK